MREHDLEPVPGLPERLPPGETLLWQGSPRWQLLARRGFRLPWLVLYFVLLAAWRGATLAQEGASRVEILAGVAWLAMLGLAVAALVVGFSILSARTTLYSITNRRVVMRVGVALPMTVNLPFATLRSAGLRRTADGGDILLALEPPHRASYVALWPHARLLRLARPEPVMRGLAEPEAAAQALARALAASAEMPVPQGVAQPAGPARAAGPAATAAA